jgi:hypothetical protein
MHSTFDIKSPLSRPTMLQKLKMPTTDKILFIFNGIFFTLFIPSLYRTTKQKNKRIFSGAQLEIYTFSILRVHSIFEHAQKLNPLSKLNSVDRLHYFGKFYMYFTMPIKMFSVFKTIWIGELFFRRHRKSLSIPGSHSKPLEHFAMHAQVSFPLHHVEGKESWKIR